MSMSSDFYDPITGSAVKIGGLGKLVTDSTVHTLLCPWGHITVSVIHLEKQFCGSYKLLVYFKS